MAQSQHSPNLLSYEWLASVIYEENLRAGFAGKIAGEAAQKAAMRIHAQLKGVPKSALVRPDGQPS